MASYTVTQDGTDGTATPSTSLDGPTVDPAPSTIVAFADTVEQASSGGGSYSGAVRGTVGTATPTTALDGPSLDPTPATIEAFADRVERSAFDVSNPSGWPRASGDTAEPTTRLDGADLAPVPASIEELNDLDTFMGALIPMAYFRTVTGRVLDEDGEPITNALWLVALDHFASAGLVNQKGEFRIFLLKQDFQNFFLVVDAAQNEVRNASYDFVWYELEGNPVVEATRYEVDLKFDTRVKRPLDLTADARFR